MITSLSDLYTNLSLQLPGVSTAVLDLELKRAERTVCRDTGIWQEDLTFTAYGPYGATDAVYEYSLNLPANADLVTSISLKDVNDNLVDVNFYEVDFYEAATVDGYHLFAETEDAETGLTGDYTDSGQTHNGQTVYTNGTFMGFLATDGVNATSDFYIYCLEADYDAFILPGGAFPTDYYAILPPASALVGTLYGFGNYTGSVKSAYLGDQGAVLLTLEPQLIDGQPQTDLVGTIGTYTSRVALMPRTLTSALPNKLLTRFAETIEKAALKSLLEYPRNFPWSDQKRAEQIASELRRLLSMAKYEHYRKLKKTSVIMRAGQSFI